MKRIIVSLMFAFFLAFSLGVAFGGAPAEEPAPMKAKQLLPEEVVKKVEKLVQEGDFPQIIELWEKYGGDGDACKEINETFRRALLGFRLVNLNKVFSKAWSSKKPYVYLPSYEVLETLKDKSAMEHLLSQIDVRPDSKKAKLARSVVIIIRKDKRYVNTWGKSLFKSAPQCRPVMREVIVAGGPKYLINLAKKVLAATKIRHLAEKIERLNRFDSPALVPYYSALLDEEKWNMDSMAKYHTLTILARYGKDHEGPVVTELLEDSDAFVRCRAAWCLGRLNYKQSAKKVAKLLDDDGRPARAAAISLADMGEKTYVKKIAAIARAKGESADAKDFVRAAAMLGERSILNSWLDGDKTETRKWGAEILAEIATKDDIPAFLKLIEGKPEAYFVYYAARGIGKIECKDEKVRAALKSAYTGADRSLYPADFDWTVKRTLILMGDKDIEKQLFENLKKEKDGVGKMQIIDEIGRIGIKSHIPVLMEYLDDNTVVYEKRIAPHIPQTISEAASMAIIRISGAKYLGLWAHDPKRTGAEIAAWWEANKEEN